MTNWNWIFWWFFRFLRLNFRWMIERKSLSYVFSPTEGSFQAQNSLLHFFQLIPTNTSSSCYLQILLKSQYGSFSWNLKLKFTFNCDRFYVPLTLIRLCSADTIRIKQINFQICIKYRYGASVTYWHPIKWPKEKKGTEFCR